MTPQEKRCIIEFLGARYRRSKKRGKGEILSELSERFGISRRQARRLLGERKPGRPRKPAGRGRPLKYGDGEFISALITVWRTTRYMCGRHLKAAIPDWVSPIEEDRGAFPEAVRQKLFEISAPTIDRILRPHKAQKGISFTRSGGFRDQIEIQESIWNIEEPGHFETDTVAHCGGSMLGDFINSLVMVDIAMTWTEARAVFGRASKPVVYAIEDIESSLPFPILGYDADNGGEVLNQHILRYFRNERIERNRSPVKITRSREYKKNDNAHVEQRNNSVARRWLGYERMDFVEIVPLVNFYYSQIVCPLMNHFFPSFKLKDKIRIKSRTRRIYDDPVTPYARVMASPHVSDERKLLLKAQHEALNPVTLVKQEQVFRKRIDEALKRLRRAQNASSLLTVPALLPSPFAKLNDVHIFRVFKDEKLPIYK